MPGLHSNGSVLGRTMQIALENVVMPEDIDVTLNDIGGLDKILDHLVGCFDGKHHHCLGRASAQCSVLIQR